MNGSHPTILVIFGATGDLANSKLLPSLFDLYEKKFLPDEVRIVEYGRRDHSNETYRTVVSESLSSYFVKKGRTETKAKSIFLSKILYVKGEFEGTDHYERLAFALNLIDKEVFQTCSNKLFYLAVPPLHYETILTHLADSGLTIPCGPGEGGTRILIEKPFGNDLATAAKLDALLGSLFEEEQIFRIDHYLAKEALQNILTFRFSNGIFEHLWNDRHIDAIDVVMAEKNTVATRGAFYDGVGALRDVGQNHILQMLALVIMERPNIFTAVRIQKERARVIASLRLSDMRGGIKKWQYAGYLSEPNIKKNSKTETAFFLNVYVDNDRFRQVPINLLAGKAFRDSGAYIKIIFKKSAECVCWRGAACVHKNTLTFNIQPNEGISLSFWVKKPGFEYEVEEKKMTFYYKDSELESELPDAYERVLYDCIRGDQSLFASTDEVKASWSFITPIVEAWKNTKSKVYDVGSDILRLYE